LRGAPLLGTMQGVSTADPGRLDRVGADPVPRRVAAVTAIAVGLAAAVMGFQVLGPNGGSSYLLEPGSTQPPSGFSSSALMLYVSPEELVTGSEIVFVGTVVGEGDRASIGVGDPEAEAKAKETGSGFTVRPVHFTVERTLQGEHLAARDLLYPDQLDEASPVFTPGDRLLIFGEARSFGAKRITGLTANGYHQGVFRMDSDEVARNETTGVRMSVPALANALAR
jgi:hypothetical protein